MNSYRVGIVGLSWITSEATRPGTSPVLGDAPPHSHLSALATIPAATVVAGCDIVPAARERFLETWGDRWPGVQVFDDYHKLLEESELDILCVATPDHLHGEVVRAAVERGVKGIFCEKPMSVSLDDADAMIATIERHGAVVNVNHTRRWMPVHVAVREAVRSGAIGRLGQVTIHFGGERAMLWRNQSHFLDLMTFYAESDPVWVTAELEAGFEDYGTSYRGDGGRTPDLEPGVNAYVAYDNGVRGFLGGMKSLAQQVSVDLIGSDGRIHASDQHAEIVRMSDQGIVTVPIYPSGTWQGMQAAILDLMRAMETGVDGECPPREARKTVALIEGILASQAAGNARIDLRRAD